MEILTEEQKQDVLNALKLSQELKKELLKARRANIDVSELEKALADAEQQLLNIKRVYIER